MSEFDPSREVTLRTAEALVAANWLGATVVLFVAGELEDEVPLTKIAETVIQVPLDGHELSAVISRLIEAGIFTQTKDGLRVSPSEFGQSIYTIIDALGDMTPPEQA